MGTTGGGRRTHAEEGFQEHLAAGDGRGSRRLRRHAHESALPEQPTPHVEVGPSVRAGTGCRRRSGSRNASRAVRRRTCSPSSRIRGRCGPRERCCRTRARPPAKRVPQVVVEIRIDAGIRQSVVERSQVQPLASEISRSAPPTPGSATSRRTCFSSIAGSRSRPAPQGQELVVRHAAPEEERQPRCQSKVIDAIGPPAETVAGAISRR